MGLGGGVGAHSVGRDQHVPRDKGDDSKVGSSPVFFVVFLVGSGAGAWRGGGEGGGER